MARAIDYLCVALVAGMSCRGGGGEEVVREAIISIIANELAEIERERRREERENEAWWNIIRGQAVTEVVEQDCERIKQEMKGNKQRHR